MKKYIIAIALFCLSLFLIDEVCAATGSYTSSTYSYTNCNGMSCSSSWATYKDLGTISNPTNKQIGDISLRAYTSTDANWFVGNNYTFRYRICESNKWTNSETLSRLRSKATLFKFTYNSSNSASTATEGDVDDVIMTITDDTASSFCWFISFNFTPKTTLRYVGFDVSFASISDYNFLAGIYTGNDFRSNGLSITYQEGVGAIFQEQTENMINEQQQTNDKLDETNEQLGNLNDNLTNNDTSGATDSAGGFFEGFTTDTFGLTSIITAPLNLIKSITSKTCTPLSLSLPYINQNVSIPCMTQIYESYFGPFLTIYQTITFGLVSYWVCVHVFRMVKDFKNPDHDEIEVMDL